MTSNTVPCSTRKPLGRRPHASLSSMPRLYLSHLNGFWMRIKPHQLSPRSSARMHCQLRKHIHTCDEAGKQTHEKYTEPTGTGIEYSQEHPRKRSFPLQQESVESHKFMEAQESSLGITKFTVSMSFEVLPMPLALSSNVTLPVYRVEIIVLRRRCRSQGVYGFVDFHRLC